MVDVASHAAVIYVSVVLASALLIIEIALPTFGIAGLCAFLLSAVAAIGIADGDFTWWPLLLCAIAVCLWAIMVARNDAPFAQQAVAAGLYALGSLLFAGYEGDLTTFVIAIGACILLPLVFPMLFERAARLRNRRPDVGMESYVGRTAPVDAWQDGKGTVMVDGSRWNAAGPAILRPGDEVVITAFEGMCFTVRASAPTPGGS